MTDRKSPAERQRERRARRSMGEELLKVRVKRGPLADALVDAGLLSQWDETDKAALEAAVERLINFWTGGSGGHE